MYKKQTLSSYEKSVHINKTIIQEEIKKLKTILSCKKQDKFVQNMKELGLKLTIKVKFLQKLILCQKVFCLFIKAK